MMDFHVRKYQYVAAAVVIVIIAGAAFYFLYYKIAKDEISVVTKGTVPGIEDAAKGGGMAQVQPQSMQPAAKALPPYLGEPIRELNGDPKLIASIGSALHEKYQKNLASIADRIEKDPLNHDDWLAVAYIKKLFSNYEGTRDAWEYAKVVNPENPIAYFNLGELYGYELKELARAEENYKSALRLNPYNFDYYVGLANFYKDVVKSPEKAEATFLSALEKIPHTESNLFAAIGAFYRGANNYAKAIEYFEKALNAASDPAVKKRIQYEIDYIRSKQ